MKIDSYCPIILDGKTVGSYSANYKNMYVTIFMPLKTGQTLKLQPTDTPHEFLVKAYRLLK